MDKKTQGAWLLHHDQKLTQTNSVSFEGIATAGRSARLLSVISKERNHTISMERVIVLAHELGVRRLEVPGLLNELSAQGLIDRSDNGVAVLGVTQASLLDHAADIFASQAPSGLEGAVIELSEIGSHSPVRRSDCEELLSDKYKLSLNQRNDLFQQSEEIGFTDYEGDAADRLYFNGALFKRDQAVKAKLLLQNLLPDERARMLQADELLEKCGCVQAGALKKVLGDRLWNKLHQIAYFEVSVVSNEAGQTEFVTKPEAISKFIPNGLSDMLDDAKALSASSTYGIVKSSSARGRIRSPMVLMNALINRGYVEGRANALIEDYKVLERRGVVTVLKTSKGYKLTLEKPEIGRMAKELILKGDASQAAAEVIVGSNAAQYFGPEIARSHQRKKTVQMASSDISRSLNILRKK